MKIISLSEIAEYLNYADAEMRSTKKWCIERDVLIFKQGQCWYAYEVEFRTAFEKPLIDKLKKKQGADWKRDYDIISNGNIPALNTLNDIIKDESKAYIPKNKSFITKLIEDAKNKAA
ncbi:MAG: hypothetical protein K0S53_2853 [Bacteroidetes bacterium]|jgi:hypothetical protein|nr:hypothetical protein [Bacteroidota bacterium]